jgi:hypothetical protein
VNKLDHNLGNLVVRIDLDGTRFDKGMATLNRQMRLVKSEFKATGAILGNSGKQLDHYQLKADTLTKQLTIQQRKVEVLRESYEKSTQEKGKDARATTIMSFSGSESVYRRYLLRYLILPVCLLSLAQFAMYIYTDGGNSVKPEASCLPADSGYKCCGPFASCYPPGDDCSSWGCISEGCIDTLNAGAFLIRSRKLSRKTYDNGLYERTSQIPAGSHTQWVPMAGDDEKPWVVYIDVFSLSGWKNIYNDTIVHTPTSCKVQGMLFYDYVLILSVVADIFCIVASIMAFRTALIRFTGAIIVAIGTVSMILSVIDLGVHWDQFPRSVLFLMAISMARIVGLLFVVAFCIWVKTKEISEEKVPLTNTSLANVSINTPNEQEA